VGIIQNIKASYAKTFRYKGRSSRLEFWTFQIYFYVGIFVTASLMALIPNYGETLFMVYLVFAFGNMPTLLAVSVRRLHDIGLSGWMLLVCFVPYFGLLIYLIGSLQKSEEGPNKYGETPNNVS
jgi:uncharacterized membrane protein YhaH (DUF805 family)